MIGSPPHTLDDYTKRLAERGVDINSIALDERGTIFAGERAPVSAPLLRLDGEIAIRAPLSKGGMGEVLLARQSSLDRDVAVKRAVPGKEMAERELLIEGRVAGRLEHPNIAPVHMLGKTEDGTPLLVMKRIEGRTWAEIMKGGADYARDLGILLDVCRALHFAHARGVIHRDVKPANVMVGAFGEVYLVDWGLAVAISDGAPPELPRARDVNAIMGTPFYLAPEMAMASGDVDARTDVFLAGAVLYEIIAGRAPYRSDSVQDALFSAAQCRPPPLPSTAPHELRAICERAMSLEKSQRFQSADELRAALLAFQSHAAARELCAEAEARLDKLRALPFDAPANARLGLFLEARFGFTQALKTWPESQQARAGLDVAVTTMARHEIDAGHHDSAQLLLSELSSAPPQDIVDGLRVLSERRARESKSVDELARVAHDQDKLVGWRDRTGLLALNAATGLLSCVLAGVLDARGIYHAAGGTMAIVDVFALLWLLIVVALRPRMRNTQASMTALLAMIVGIIALVVLHAVGWFVGMQTWLLLALTFVVLGTSLAARATDDRRIWPAPLVAWAAVPLIVAWPAAAWFIAAACYPLALMVSAAMTFDAHRSS